MQPNIITGNRTQLGQYQPRNNPHPYGISSNPYALQNQRNIAPGNTLVHQNASISGVPSNYVGNTSSIFSNVSMSTFCNVTDSIQILPPVPTPCSLRFRQLPFYKMKHEILRPSILNSNSHLTLPTVIKSSATHEFQFAFVMNCAMASEIAMNRDITKNEFVVQAQLRITAVDVGSTTPLTAEYDDFLPLGLGVRVNGRQCITLPPCSPCARQNQESRRIPRPISVTHLMKLTPMNPNLLIVNWAQETGKQFIITLNLVEKLSSEFLLNKLREKPKISVDVTKLLIRQQYRRIDTDDSLGKVDDDDDDIATTIVRVSLLCPLVKFRIKYPAKGKNCSHLQCFDGAAYISLNEKKPMWNCPVCNRSLYYDDLILDEYFINVLNNDELSSDCQEVQLLVDGTWKSYSEEASTENKDSETARQKSSTSSPERKQSTSSLENTTTKVSELETANLNSDVVDLLSDEESEDDNTATSEPTNVVQSKVETQNTDTSKAASKTSTIETKAPGNETETNDPNKHKQSEVENGVGIQQTSASNPTTSNSENSKENNKAGSIISLDSPSPPTSVSPTHPPIADLNINN